MNSISRGMRNAFRTPLRSGAIVLILAISIGLILAMLVARSSINQKIESVKSQAGTTISINPAGIRGGMGGGTPLTTDQISKITSASHVTTVASSLSDQLGTDDTNLTSSLTLGSFGQRQQRFEQATPPVGESTSTEESSRPAPTPRINVTGTNTPTTTISEDKLTSGTMIDGNSTTDVALVGKSLAEKNSLSVGSTFTAYGKTFTVSGIYSSGNTFEDSGIIVPLATLQSATDQAGSVTAVTATVDSIDNVEATVASLKTTLGDSIDITSQLEQANASASALEGVASLALYGVIGAAAAGTVIILLSMVIIVRERRREIGIIKAIGGSNRSVITQFMSEALTLTVIGGVVGLVFGVLVSGPMTTSLVTSQASTQARAAGPGTEGGVRGAFRATGNQLATNLQTVTASITPQVFAISGLAMLLIALLGSILPSWLVARVQPAEVLRTE